MPRFTFHKIENILNQVSFGMGSTPARLSFYLGHLAFFILSLTLLTSFVAILLSIMDAPPMFLASMLMITFSSVFERRICRSNLNYFFPSVGTVAMICMGIYFFPTRTSTISYSALLFLISSNWCILDSFCTTSVKAIEEEKNVLERGFLPLAKPAYLVYLVFFCILCSPVLLAYTVMQNQASLSQVVVLDTIILTQIMLAISCLLRLIIPRPPSKRKSSRVGEKLLAATKAG